MDSRIPNVFHILQCTLFAGAMTFPRKAESLVLGELPFFLFPPPPQCSLLLLAQVSSPQMVIIHLLL